MGRNRFAAQEIDRITLSDGDWIEVKRDLNNGDDKKLMVAGQKDVIMVDGKPIFPIDWEVYEIERCMIYLVDWSFRDANDKPVKLNTAAMRALAVEDFKEVNDAITAHILARSLAKKGLRETMKMTSQMTPGSTPSPTTDGPSADQTSS